MSEMSPEQLNDMIALLEAAAAGEKDDPPTSKESKGKKKIKEVAKKGELVPLLLAIG